MGIRIATVTPTIGATISAVDLNRVENDEVYEEIKQALWKHQVLFFRNQQLTPEAYVQLGARFGNIEKHEFFPHVDGFPQIQAVSHEGCERPETDRWHADVTHRKSPSLVTVLRAVELPPGGGDTMWASMAAAFEALPDALKTMLLGLRADHDYSFSQRRIDFYERYHRRQDSTPQDQEIRALKANPVSTHPLVITHPHTERLTLFVNSIWTKKIRDIHLDIGDGILRTLFEWIKRPEFQVRFRWEPDSIAMWDNLATQHYAVFDYAPHRRRMHRITAGSFEPRLDLARVPRHLLPPMREDRLEDRSVVTAGPPMPDSRAALP